MQHWHLLKLQLQAHNLDLSWSATSAVVDTDGSHGNGRGEGEGLMVSYMGETRNLGVLVKLHSQHDQLLSVTFLGVEVAVDSVAVAKEETTAIVAVSKEEADVELFAVAMAGATAFFRLF